MELQQIQILHRDPDFRDSLSARKLLESLHTAFPLAELRCGTNPGSVMAEGPALVLLHMSSPERLMADTRAARSLWPYTIIFGLIDGVCPLRDDVEQTLIAELDDYVVYPCEVINLVPRLRRLMRTAACVSPAAAAFSGHIEGVIGRSAALRVAVNRVPLLARSPATVLISGATGTGKELFARAIHYASVRHSKAFVPVNCGALPDQLFENELFGHERGAYTDASSAERGLLALAEGGTLMLDEIDSLSPSCQVKLLRFLQEQEYRPLGSAHVRKADVRVIAATNANLHALVAGKGFRADLFYRLNILNLHLPSLAERSEDIPLLADHFLRRFSDAHCRETPRLSAAAIRKLTAYSWPGNVRELEGVMQRVVALTDSPVILPSDMDLSSNESPETEATVFLRPAKARAAENFERAYLVDLLTAHRGNVSQAARAAGKDRRTFQRLIRKHSLEREQFENTVA